MRVIGASELLAGIGLVLPSALLILPWLTVAAAALRARRDNGRVGAALDALKRAAEGAGNTMPYLLEAVRAYATLGEICDSLRAVFGGYTETPRI